MALSVVQSARRRGIALRARLVLECGSVRELAAAIDAEAADGRDVDVANQTTRQRADTAAGQRPLALRIRRAAQAGAGRSDSVAGRASPASNCARRWPTIVDGHEVLRSRLDRATMTLHADQPSDMLTEVTVSGDLQAAVGAQTAQAIDGLDPERGKLLAAAWLRPTDRAERAGAGRARAGHGPGVVAGGARRTRRHPACTDRRDDARRRCVSTPATGAGFSAMTERAEALDSEPYWAAATRR